MQASCHPFYADVWLADEDPDHETQAWCAANGVRISCRKGVEAYHRAEWPRRTRCKEGNLAFFYDHWGYEQYDVVAQFDADHVPHHDYLSTVTPAFLDDSVGYVALPSICGSNEKGKRAGLHRDLQACCVVTMVHRRPAPHEWAELPWQA
jgi:cellulose synthase/poly-beta-1,6-N-acetylglucosamine synthase-like glycosyltransferase